MANLSPEVIQSLLAMEDPESDPEAIEMARKQKMVDALRGKALGGMQGQMVGNNFVAPSAAAQVANLATLGMGMGAQKDIDASTRKSATARAGNRKTYADALIRALRSGGLGGAQAPVITEPGLEEDQLLDPRIM